MRILLLLIVAALAATAACNPVRTAGDVAIGAGQVALAGADLLI